MRGASATGSRRTAPRPPAACAVYGEGEIGGQGPAPRPDDEPAPAGPQLAAVPDTEISDTDPADATVVEPATDQQIQQIVTGLRELRATAATIKTWLERVGWTYFPDWKPSEAIRSLTADQADEFHTLVLAELTARAAAAQDAAAEEPVETVDAEPVDDHAEWAQNANDEDIVRVASAAAGADQARVHAARVELDRRMPDGDPSTRVPPPGPTTAAPGTVRNPLANVDGGPHVRSAALRTAGCTCTRPLAHNRMGRDDACPIQGHGIPTQQPAAA